MPADSWRYRAHGDIAASSCVSQVPKLIQHDLGSADDVTQYCLADEASG